MALIARYGGDRSHHDMHSVMRLPGFFHQKGEPHLVRIIEVNDLPPYAADDFRPQPRSRTSRQGATRPRTRSGSPPPWP